MTSHNSVRICLYRGAARLADGSGIGSAIRHQSAMLEHAAVTVVPPWGRPHIVQLNTVFPDSVLVGLLARLTGARVVAFAHSTREDFEDSWFGSTTVAPLVERWLALAYRVGHVVVTPTPYSAGIIGRYGLRRPVHVLTNGVDTTYFDGDPAAGRRFRRAHGLTDARPVVLGVGHLMVRKGICEYAQLAEQMPEADFLWAGSMPRAAMTPAVRAAIDGAPPNLRLLGRLPRDQVRAAYAAADLFCFPSHEETQGIVVLEALASGVPVLVRDIGAYAGWLADGVTVHTAASTPDFADRARAILRGDAPDLRAAGRALARTHDVRRVSADLAAIHAASGVSGAGCELLITS